MDSQVYDLPAPFYDDHVARALPAGVLVKRLARTVRVELDHESYDELLSDARHYAEAMGDAGYGDTGMIASARATMKRLQAAPFVFPFPVSD